MQIKVFVTPKKDILDPQGKIVKQTIAKLGYKGIKDVRVGKYILLEAEGLNPKEAMIYAKEISDKVLANPIIEDYQIEIQN